MNLEILPPIITRNYCNAVSYHEVWSFEPTVAIQRTETENYLEELFTLYMYIHGHFELVFILL